MKDSILFCNFILLCSYYLQVNSQFVFTTIRRQASVTLARGEREKLNANFRVSLAGNVDKNSFCWLTLNASGLFKTMNAIDRRYEDVRSGIQKYAQANKFDKKMIETILFTRGAAVREVYNQKQHGRVIPSGLNFDGYNMLKMLGSVLFFHRMKLRNDTRFRIDNLKNDFKNMMLQMQLSLNDLNLVGAYERSLIEDRDISSLLYSPTFGEIELLLKNVIYKMEGRYRLIKKRLVIEVVTSEIELDNIQLKYISNSTKSTNSLNVKKTNLGGFMERLKANLDKWLKDYFNDYLIYLALDDMPKIDQLEKYDKEKAKALGEYYDNALQTLSNKLNNINGNELNLPKFTIRGLNGMQIELKNGFLRGLESMYRRSVATSVQVKDVRKVDAIIGFSNLKVVYNYELRLPTTTPPVTGVMTLSADELTGHLAISQVAKPETVDLNIDFIDQMKPESLVVEGAANMMIVNFKHLLQNHIMSLMSNALDYGVRLLRSLPRCKPFAPGPFEEPEQRRRMYNLPRSLEVN